MVICSSRNQDYLLSKYSSSQTIDATFVPSGWFSEIFRNKLLELIPGIIDFYFNPRGLAIEFFDGVAKEQNKLIGADEESKCK